ncbi:MAG: Asp-tRNA(Asn)/Glu-tRNA(Gln) amidotransferase subunit GatC [Anaerolineales bacterium]|nr:Asp-tRNA(Asn)/Glu-tRNA(Gln) amidotransferase subunit GatC [Anaerolineales bacterium]
MSTLTIKDVEKIALLARLELSDAEKEMYRQTLSNVLDYVEKINELDLDGVPPTTHAVAQQNVLREDIVNSALNAEEALANAAAQADNQFAIQAVFD